jgi:hypothetical protein
MTMPDQTSGKKLDPKISKKITLENLFQTETLNMVFYDDSFTKTKFFVKMISKQNIPIFYFDTDLLYSGYLVARETPQPKNTTIFSLNNNNLYENFKSTINKISKTKSLVILDSLNGFYNLFDVENNSASIINSFIMLLTSAARNAESQVVIASLSKLNDENIWTLYNNGRHIIENKHITKIHLTSSENVIVAKVLNTENPDLILEI